MVAFIPTIPNPGDFLDTTSQPQLRNNNLALDARFGVDHYEFSDSSGQSGKHNRVTTPVYITEPVPNGLPPVIIATEPVIAAFQQTVPFGVLQYSYGWNVAGNVQQVPTPITSIQSQATGISLSPTIATNIMDFSGLSLAIAIVYAFDSSPGFSLLDFLHIAVTVFWNGVTFTIVPLEPTLPGGFLQITNTGNILQLKNGNSGAPPFTVTYPSCFWTMQMLRMQ